MVSSHEKKEKYLNRKKWDHQPSEKQILSDLEPASKILVWVHFYLKNVCVCVNPAPSERKIDRSLSI